MSNSQYRVRALIRDVRARWRRRALVQGAALTVGAIAMSGVLVLVLLGNVSPVVLLVACLACVVAITAITIGCLIRPYFRPISDRDVALFVEERLPELEDRLNAAVEISDPDAERRVHGALVDHLMEDVAQRSFRLPVMGVVERGRERVLVWASAAAMVVFLVLGYGSMDELRLAASTGTLLPLPRAHMTIDPGNAEIEQGDSQPVIVTLRESSAKDVQLHYRSDDGPWHIAEMEAAAGEPSYLHEFLDVQAPIEYFVEHESERSSVYRISLYTFPAVDQIDLTYTFPSYTGLPPERIENSGDIRAVRGTRVTLDVATSGSTETAELVLDDGTTIPLESAGDGAFRGDLTLDQPGFYTIRLTDRQRKTNKFPEEYRITPLDDLPPRIAVTIPQRDVRANAVEEVLVAARIEDDFGIRDARLRYAVNGGEEQTVSLKDNAPGRPLEMEGEHLFFLEDFSLQPGDVVAYYVEAEDFSDRSTEAGDMYFIEVIPFDRDYTQVAGGGGGMQGGGQNSGVVLSQQQIIAATWKLHRERDRMDPAEFTDSREALAQAQDNLRSNIQERIGETAFSLELQRGEETRAIANHLRSAVAAMQRAVLDLGADRLREALQPEREALNHLLRADALNRERQIALNRNGQAGGGNAGATEERMTELMDLELDISKDKYEMMQPSSGSAGSGAVDETLRKLQELARRQESLAEQSSRPLEGEDRRRQVERLQRDQQDLQRDAENLSQRIREMGQQQGGLSGQTEQQMERAAQRMRDAERQLREGNVDQARTSQQQALNDLERIARDMQMTSADGQRQMVDEMEEAFEAIRNQERRLEQEINRATEQAQNGRIDPQALERMAEQRSAIRQQMDRLQQRAEALARGNEPDLAGAARDLQREMRRQAIDEQMEDSEDALRRGWLDNARRRQEAISRSLDDLEQPVRALDGQLPVSDEQDLTRTIEELRDLERELRALEQLATGGDQPATDSPESPQPGSQESQSSGQASAEQPGTAGGNGQAGRADRAEATRREARMNRIREQLSRLEEQLQEGGMARPLAGIRRALSRAENPNDPISKDEAASFFNDEVFAPLSQLEEALLRELDAMAIERKLRAVRPDDVPPEYRDLVERYYETLSRGEAR